MALGIGTFCGPAAATAGAAGAAAPVGAGVSMYRPKIILPAVVCSTLVTTMSMLRLIMRRALSTTTIVPSSRYATPWLYSLPSLRMNTFMNSPGSTTGFSALASSLMLSTSTPRSCATLLRLKSLVTILPWSVRPSSISLRSTSRVSGKVDVGDHDVDAGHLLDLLKDVEPAAAAVALQRVGGVGDELQLLEHELRDHERAVEEAGLADVGDAAVDDHAGVEDAIALLRAGVAEEADQPLRLEPLPLPGAHHDAEIREDEQDEAVQEDDAMIGGVGPEERGADGLGEPEADGAADERAEQIGDLRFAQPRFDEHDQRAERRADADIDDEQRMERPQERRGPGDGGNEARASDDMPGHGYDSGYE